MKLYAIGVGGQVKLFPLDESGAVSQITLGEGGRGRALVTVRVIGQGSEVRIKRAGTGVVLVRGDWPAEDRCLAVVDTVGSYDRSRSYDLFDATGVQVLVSGTKAFGDAGRINGGPVYLAICEPGAEFRLNSKYDSKWYLYDGAAWRTETTGERKARLALEAVEAGEGEWL